MSLPIDNPKEVAIFKFLYDEKVFLLENQKLGPFEELAGEVSSLITLGDLKKGEKILDLCCGQGNHTLELAGRGYDQVLGTDISPPLLVEAVNRQSTIPAASSATFHLADGLCMDQFTTSSFDKVLLLGNSIAYISPENRVSFLKEAGRVLKQEGLLILDQINFDYFVKTFNPRTWHNVDSKQIVLHEREISSNHRCVVTRSILLNKDKGVLLERTYSERIFSFDELSALLQEAGFVDIVSHERQGSKHYITAKSTSDVQYPPPLFPVVVQEVPYGKGLFAARDILIGEVVQRFTGPICPYEKVSIEEQIYACWTNGLYTIPVTVSRYTNHSCDPNCVTNSLREIVAKKTIKQGEELTFCYNLSDTWDFWDPKWDFECFCGAEKCQKNINCYVDKFGNKFLGPTDK